MKRLFVSIIFAALATVDAASAAEKKSDYLEPVFRDDPLNNKHLELVTTKLGITPFDYGRLITIPSFVPESCLSMYSTVKSDGRKYYVTYTEATSYLRRLISLRKKSKEDEGTHVKRFDAEISKETAEKVRQIWMQMLKQKRVRPPWNEVQDPILEFSIQRSGKPLLEAQLTMPPLGPKTEALVKLSDALSEYAQAPNDQKARAIGEQAKRLLEMLKQGREKGSE